LAAEESCPFSGNHPILCFLIFYNPFKTKKMTKRSVQLLAAPLMIAAFCALNAFKAPVKDIVNGGGFTADAHFNFNAVDQKDGSTTGHLSYGDLSTPIDCVAVDGNAATIYYTEGSTKWAVTIVDNGEGNNASPDQISDPFQPDLLLLCTVQDALEYNDVTGGNIQVH
jgi:hypothetical protein